MWSLLLNRTLFQADYRLDGKEELICCSIDGEVRGYLPPSLSDTYTKGRDQSEEYLALEELSKKKQVREYGVTVTLAVLHSQDYDFH